MNHIDQLSSGYFQKAQSSRILGCYRTDIIKSGEGSRGGKIIGHTSSGKAIYAVKKVLNRRGSGKSGVSSVHEDWHNLHKDFSKKDHEEAHELHKKLGQKISLSTTDKKAFGEKTIHADSALAHKAAAEQSNEE